MRRIMLKSKIQKISVTETNLDYEGSLTLDEGEIDFFMPKILIADENNRIKKIK